MIEAALAHEMIVKKGSWLSFEGEQLGQGQEGAREYLEQHPDFTQKLIQKINEKLGRA